MNSGLQFDASSSADDFTSAITKKVKLLHEKEEAVSRFDDSPSLRADGDDTAAMTRLLDEVKNSNVQNVCGLSTLPTS